MSFIGGLKKFFVAIGHGFEKVVGKARAKSFGAEALHLLETDFGKIVKTVVTQLETARPAMPGKVKFEQAFEAIKAQSITEGLDVKDSLIHMFIELAVSVIKGNFAASADAPPPPAPETPIEASHAEPVAKVEAENADVEVSIS